MVEGKREMQIVSSINDIGDLRTAGAPSRHRRDRHDRRLRQGYETGATVDLPDWKTKVDVADRNGAAATAGAAQSRRGR